MCRRVSCLQNLRALLSAPHESRSVAGPFGLRVSCAFLAPLVFLSTNGHLGGGIVDSHEARFHRRGSPVRPRGGSGPDLPTFAVALPLVICDRRRMLMSTCLPPPMGRSSMQAGGRPRKRNYACAESMVSQASRRGVSRSQRSSCQLPLRARPFVVNVFRAWAVHSPAVPSTFAHGYSGLSTGPRREIRAPARG